jgi:hypothetical protein
MAPPTVSLDVRAVPMMVPERFRGLTFGGVSLPPHGRVIAHVTAQQTIELMRIGFEPTDDDFVQRIN